MAERTGLNDIKFAFTIISAAIAVNNVMERGLLASEEKKRHFENKRQLDRMEKELRAIYAKLTTRVS